MTSHIELLEFGELTDLRWHRQQLIAIELKEKRRRLNDSVRASTMDTSFSMTPHIKELEVGELTNLRWQRLQLVAIELKE